MADEPSGVSVKVADLTCRFGAVTAVDHVTFDIQPGEFLALLGPSGSGKTTILMSIAGFARPAGGSIRLADRDVTSLPPWARNIGMVFQKYALFPHLTVAQNIAFPLVQRQVPRSRIRSEIAAVVDLVGLSGLENRPSTDLSGGQQQRVALARALVYRPAVLLMDEPLGALDRKLRERLQVELKDIQRVTGTTVLFVTHDQTEALTMSDRVAVVNHGRIEQIGQPEDLYERPASSFVADFIGEANIFAGTVIGAEGEVCRMQLRDGSVVCGTIAGAGSRPVAGTHAEIVLRPAKIRLLADPAAAPVRGKVSGVNYAGETISVRLDTDAGPRLVVRSTRPRERPAIGQLLGVDWHASDARVFPSSVQ